MWFLIEVMETDYTNKNKKLIDFIFIFITVKIKISIYYQS